MSELEVPTILKPQDGATTTVDPDIEIKCTPGAKVMIYGLSSLTECTIGSDGLWTGRPARSLVPKKHTFHAVHVTGDDKSKPSPDVTFTASNH
ncbi:hypothetical protein [Pseudomonas sp. NFX224]|uniref:hypothetical protein n=1 Tax=Pseudomonas sp. NFX224 TaxID=3402862 RepID=UPI003AFA9606